MSTLTEHRLTVLEQRQAEHEGRLRALEVGYAKILGLAAGGAFTGGALFQLFTYLVK